MKPNREQIVKELVMFIEDMPVELHLGLRRTIKFRELLKDALALIKKLYEEITRLEYIRVGVMHSVDKWLDGEELDEQDEVIRAATMREKLLQIVERLTEENAEVKANWQKLKESHENACEECRAEFKKLTEENEGLLAQQERLKKRVEEIALGAKKEVAGWERHYKLFSEIAIETAKKTVRADTVRKMQERLYEEFLKVANCQKADEPNMKSQEVFRILDYIAKEMLNGVENNEERKEYER